MPCSEMLYCFSATYHNKKYFLLKNINGMSYNIAKAYLSSHLYFQFVTLMYI